MNQFFDMLRQSTARLLRAPFRELRKNEEDTNSAIVVDAIDFLSRTKDSQLVREKAKFRYAIALKQEKTSESGFSTDYEYYVRGLEGAKFDFGIYPAISTGVGTRIVTSIATLFNQPDQYWQYVREDSDKSVDDVAEAIKLIRIRGNFGGTLARADFIASSVESAILHTYFKGFRLTYDVVSPAAIWFIFGKRVTEYSGDGKQEVERAIDPGDIDDASAVIIQLEMQREAAEATGDANKDMYLAYVGRGETDPEGRMVVYEADKYWPIPEIGDDSILSEYTHPVAGVVCNPLTWLQNHGDSLAQNVSTEYPVTVIRGGLSPNVGGIKPTVTTLYDSAVEIEVGWSKLYKDSLSLARGQDVFKLVTSTKLPRSFEIVVLRELDEYQKLWGGAAELTAAADFHDRLATAIAGGFSVPQYMVIGQAMVAPSSGVSLAIQTQPLIDYRGNRAELNESAIDRQWGIEKGLISGFSSEVGKKMIGVKQIWNPGTWTPPEAEADRIAGILAARQGELIDHYEAVRRYHRLKTTEEAIELVGQYEERDPDYGGGQKNTESGISGGGFGGTTG